MSESVRVLIRMGVKGHRNDFNGRIDTQNRQLEVCSVEVPRSRPPEPGVSFCGVLLSITFHWDPPITFHHESHCMPGPIISSDLSLEPVVTSELVGSGIHGASVNGPSLRDLFQWLWTPVGT